jgi:hypothetical protein
MFKSTVLFPCLALALAAAFPHAARAADHDYYVHFGGTDSNAVGDITIEDQYDLPMVPKNGACGMRFTGAEHYGWVNEYTDHLGTTSTGGNVIQVRLQDRPGCSGSGIEIKVGNAVVNLPAFDIESFVVYQASTAKWINNSNQVIAPPACGSACGFGDSFRILRRAPEWQTAIFALFDANPAAQRNGGTVRDGQARVRSLLTLDLPAKLARLSAATRDAVQARRANATRPDDAFIRDQEDTALAALSGASSSTQLCVNAWSLGDNANATLVCERAARLAQRAYSAIDVLAESL